MINRKEDQGTAAIEELKKELGPETPVEWMHCDMGNLKEIQSVCQDIKNKENRLDLVSCSQLESVTVGGRANES